MQHLYFALHQQGPLAPTLPNKDTGNVDDL
jgi:hypothetical protein